MGVTLLLVSPVLVMLLARGLVDFGHRWPLFAIYGLFVGGLTCAVVRLR